MINEEALDAIASNIGLTTLQTQIILELMKHGGQCTAPELHSIINKQMKVNRTTIYSSLEKLSQENLIIETESENKTKIYGLASNNPKVLIDKIRKPRENAYENLEVILQKAKEEGIKPAVNPMAYYSLTNRKMLTNYVQELIETSEKYILIQGNSLFLREIYPYIQDKSSQNKIDIFIQITWSPRSQSDLQEVYDLYTEILPEDRIAHPHPFYNEILPNLLNPKIDLKDFNDPQKFLQYLTDIHFIQLLSDQASLVGVHFGSEEEAGGGYYTRDPFTTQIFYNIFFLVFESSIGKKIDRAIIKGIVKDRIVSNFNSFVSIKKEK